LSAIQGNPQWGARLSGSLDGWRVRHGGQGLRITIVVRAEHARECIFVAPVLQALQRQAVALSDFQQQIGRAVDSGLRGEFDQPTDGDPDLGQIAGRMSQLVAGVSSAVSDLSGMMRRIAGGDLSARIGGHHHGVFAELARDANTTAERLSQIVDEIETATVASTLLWICNFSVSPNRRT
jgi:methyl-accepting chemotaxis protein